MSATSKFSSLPRTKSLAGKPPSREERTLAELERWFPGSEWIEPSPASTSPGLLTGQDPREGGERARSVGSPYYIVGGGKYDPKALRKWLKSLRSDDRLEVPEIVRFRKDGSPALSVESLVLELRPDVIQRPLRSDRYGSAAKLAVAGDLASDSFDQGTLVLVGHGARVARARNAVERIATIAPRLRPPLVELP